MAQLRRLFSPLNKTLQTIYLLKGFSGAGLPARHPGKCPGFWVSGFSGVRRANATRGAPRSVGIPPASACSATLHAPRLPPRSTVPGGVWCTIAQTKTKSTLKCTTGCDFVFLLCSIPIKAKKAQVCYLLACLAFQVCVCFAVAKSLGSLGIIANCYAPRAPKKPVRDTLQKSRKAVFSAKKRKKPRKFVVFLL